MFRLDRKHAVVTGAGSILSNASWVWRTTSPRCRLSESMMLAVPEMMIMLSEPNERAMPRENLGDRGL